MLDYRFLITSGGLQIDFSLLVKTGMRNMY